MAVGIRIKLPGVTEEQFDNAASLSVGTPMLRLYSDDRRIGTIAEPMRTLDA
jgi:hypothetical protein